MPSLRQRWPARPAPLPAPAARPHQQDATEPLSQLSRLPGYPATRLAPRLPGYPATRLPQQQQARRRLRLPQQQQARRQPPPPPPPPHDEQPQSAADSEPRAPQQSQRRLQSRLPPAAAPQRRPPWPWPSPPCQLGSLAAQQQQQRRLLPTRSLQRLGRGLDRSSAAAQLRLNAAASVTVRRLAAGCSAAAALCEGPAASRLCARRLHLQAGGAGGHLLHSHRGGVPSHQECSLWQ